MNGKIRRIVALAEFWRVSTNICQRTSHTPPRTITMAQQTNDRFVETYNGLGSLPKKYLVRVLVQLAKTTSVVSAQQNALGEISRTIRDPQIIYKHLVCRTYRGGYTASVTFRSRRRSSGIVSSFDPIGRNFFVSPNRMFLFS